MPRSLPGVHSIIADVPAGLEPAALLLVRPQIPQSERRQRRNAGVCQLALNPGFRHGTNV